MQIILNGNVLLFLKNDGSSESFYIRELRRLDRLILEYLIEDSIPTDVDFPKLVDPSLSISYNAPLLMRVGDVVPSSTASLNFSRGSIDPQFTAESPYRSGEATNYGVSLSGASIQYSDSGTGTSYSIPSFTRDSKGTVSLNASVDYKAGVQPKDSKGNDYKTPLPAGTVHSSKRIEFILPFWWGLNKSENLQNLSELSEDLSEKGQKKYKYPIADNDYCYLAYDASYGPLESILDKNNFENINSWETYTVTFDNYEYIVYRSGFAITGDSSFTFIF